MNKLFAEGGMMDDSGEVVKGVEVPTGSLASEVADDIPAQLSEGEFVIPADVVRYIGLEKLMAIRDKAKQGLSRMEEMGQMGNADQVNNPDQTFAEEDGEYEDDDFEGNIDSIMAEDGGEEVKMAAGGYMTGTDLSKAPKNSAIDVRYFKHPDGRRIYITYINNRPMTAIPEGFTETDDIVEKQVGKEAEEKEAAKTASTDDVKQTGGSAFDTISSGGTAVVSGNKNYDLIDVDPVTGKATAKKLSKVQKGLALMLGVPGLAVAGVSKLAASAQEDSWNNAFKAGNIIQSSTIDPTSNSKTPAWIDISNVEDTGFGLTKGSSGTDRIGISTNATTRAQDERTFGGYFDSSGNFVETDKATAAKSVTTPVTTPTSSQTTSNFDYSRGDNSSNSYQSNAQDATGIDGSTENDGYYAKGGMVNKREAKPKKPTKGKGLAASKK